MAKAAMNNLLKRRMTASQQASELRTGDEAYEKLFREAPPPGEVQIRSLPLDKLVPFSPADVYPQGAGHRVGDLLAPLHSAHSPPG